MKQAAQATSQLAEARDTSVARSSRLESTGPQIKALGRDLAERIILEHVVDGIVQLAA